MLPGLHILLVACLAAAKAVLGSPVRARTNYAVKDSHNVPPRWCKTERASANHVIQLQIGLQQSNFAELERNLYEVSDPAHTRYGQHLSADEVNELVKPTDEALELVHEWLAANGIESDQLNYSPAKDWITVSLPVSAVENLLDTEYSVFVHEKGTEIVRAPEWSLPIHLHQHIVTIQPTNSFFRPSPRAKLSKSINYAEYATAGFPPIPDSSTVEQVCDPNLVTPLCLSSFYGTVNYTVKAAGQNYMALNDFLGEINNRSDTEIYLQKFRPGAAAGAFQFSQLSIAGGTTQQTPENSTQLDAGTGIEGNLDVQTMIGIAWPVPLVAYSTGGVNPDFVPDRLTTSNTDEPYLVWLQYILAQDKLPSVISTSYDDDEQTIPYAYAAQTCNMFAQLGARGVSVFFGSGDSGVGSTGDCYSNDGKNTPAFLPQFPSSCPYVTAVGGTRNFDPEIAVLDSRFSPPFTSGGGFSNLFPRPSYQDSAVSNYLQKYVGTKHEGLYNTSGRGIPDIAAQSGNFSSVWNGALLLVDGTSASTPAAASIFALVNDALIAAGQSPLGFLNPWLYSGGHEAFNDILTGNSAGCGTDGFPAEPGWDAVTGYGSPYFPSILTHLGLSAT